MINLFRDPRKAGQMNCRAVRIVPSLVQIEESVDKSGIFTVINLIA